MAASTPAGSVMSSTQASIGNMAGIQSAGAGASNPLRDISITISARAMNIATGDPIDLKSGGKYTVVNIGPRGIYNSLRQGASTPLQKSGIFSGIIEIVREFQAKASTMAKSRGKDDNTYLTDNGTTKFNSLDENTLLMIAFEIFSILIKKYVKIEK